MDTTEDPRNGFSQCGSCDAPSFSCWCLDCEEALCTDCVSAHRRVSVTRSHRLLNQPPAGAVSTPPTKFCRLHPSEPLKLFCLTCNHLTCRDCQLMTHMNHRYEFASEALAGLKKQLEDQVLPMRAQSDTARRSLRDMETRLQDIVQYESCLMFELQQSYGIFLRQLKKRMDDLTKEIQKVHESERQRIQRRMVKLKELQETLQSVTEAAEKAKNTNDLMALHTYKTQIEPQLKGLLEQDLSPPQLMPQMKVVTDSNSLMTLLNFGKLEVSWIPFCVSKASVQDPGAPGTSSSHTVPPPTTTHLESTCSLQTGNANDTNLPASVNGPAAPSSGHRSAAYTLFAPCSASTSFTSSTSNSSFCKALPQTGTTSDSVSVCKPSAFQVHLPSSSTSVSCSLTPTYTAPVSTHLSLVSSCQNLKQFNVPLVTSSAVNSSLFIQPLQPLSSWTMRTLSKTNTNPSQGQLKCVQQFSAYPLVVQPDKSGLVISAGSSSTHTVLKSMPVVLHQSPSPGQNQPASIQLTTRYQLYSPSLGSPPLTIPQPPKLGKTVPVQVSPVSSSPLILPAPTTENWISVGPSPTAQGNPKQTSNHQTLTDRSSAGPTFSLQIVAPDIRPDSSLPKHVDLSHVVKAVADSACDHGVQQVEVRQQEPAENEPTSTMCEEAEPLESEPTDSDSEEPQSVTGQQVYRSSRWQPKVSLFRLPVPPARPGRRLPAFRLVQGDTDNELYLEEMSDDCESHADGVSEQPSSPESPVSLQIVSCSACGSANGSIICFSCGRGYHRDCHVPPIGPDICSEWVCSLCQDLSDPLDPYSSERPQRLQTPCLSLLEQRRCESLLLYLMVEGCSRLSQSHLKLISERLSLRRAPYPTAAEFLSDIWGLFEQTTSSQDDVLRELQKSFRIRTVKTLGPELHPSLLTLPDTGPLQQHPSTDVAAESRLKETRKRLRQFLVLMGAVAAKRTKTE